MAASSSGWSAGAALLRPPTERLLQLPDGDVRLAVCERLAIDVAGDGECGHVSRSGRVCVHARRGGAHSHCCGGVVTPLREDARFREACAAEPGLAAERRHADKLDRQYGLRRPGTSLIPLVVEIGGRWHPTVPRLVRRLAKDASARSANPGLDVAATMAARWGARLSALLIRGNAAVQRAAHCEQRNPPRPWVADVCPLPHLLPEGSCSFELACVGLEPPLSDVDGVGA